MGTKVSGGGSRADKPLLANKMFTCTECGQEAYVGVGASGRCNACIGTSQEQQEEDITLRCRTWAISALRTERNDLEESDEPLSSPKMRHISQRLIRLEAAHSVGQVLEILEEHSSVMAQTMTEQILEG